MHSHLVKEAEQDGSISLRCNTKQHTLSLHFIILGFRLKNEKKMSLRVKVGKKSEGRKQHLLDALHAAKDTLIQS